MATSRRMEGGQRLQDHRRESGGRGIVTLPGRGGGGGLSNIGCRSLGASVPLHATVQLHHRRPPPGWRYWSGQPPPPPVVDPYGRRRPYRGVSHHIGTASVWRGRQRAAPRAPTTPAAGQGCSGIGRLASSDYLTATARASLAPFPRPPTLCTAPTSPSTLPLVKPIRVCDVLHDGRRILRVLLWPTLPSPASGFRHCTHPLSPPPCIDDRVLVSPPRPPPSPPPLPPSRPPLPASPADGRLWWRRACHDGRRGGRRPAARLALPPRLPLPRGRPRQPAVARPPGARRPQRRPDAAAGAAGPLRHPPPPPPRPPPVPTAAAATAPSPKLSPRRPRRAPPPAARRR